MKKLAVEKRIATAMTSTLMVVGSRVLHAIHIYREEFWVASHTGSSRSE